MLVLKLRNQAKAIISSSTQQRAHHASVRLVCLGNWPDADSANSNLTVCHIYHIPPIPESQQHHESRLRIDFLVSAHSVKSFCAAQKCCTNILHVWLGILTPRQKSWQAGLFCTSRLTCRNSTTTRLTNSHLRPYTCALYAHRDSPLPYATKFPRARANTPCYSECQERAVNG